MSGHLTLDLNSDVGELPGREGAAVDAGILRLVTSANVACGGHAGDRESMRRICELAASNGVALGAQVSFVDREGFGRRRLDVPPSILVEQLREQLGLLAEISAAAGWQVTYLRPHGALYNGALISHELAQAVVAATPAGMSVLCLGGTRLADAAAAAGHPVIPEIFADRALTAAGLLVPRTQPGAVIADPQTVADRLANWVRTGELPSREGSPVKVRARSICTHSDTPAAVELLAGLRATLVSAGARLEPFAPPDTGAHAGAGLPARRQARKATPGLVGYRCGERAVLVEVPAGTAAAWARTLRRLPMRGFVEAVPAECTLLVVTQTAASVDSVLSHLAQLDVTPASADSFAEVVIEVDYQGEDLAAVAAATGLTSEEVIAVHSGAEYTSAFCGFAPGFSYLSGLPPSLHLPRRTNPRTRVPAGSVAIAARYSAVYPTSSPGGWHLLGVTDRPLFDPSATQPALLEPGTRVRFRPI